MVLIIPISKHYLMTSQCLYFSPSVMSYEDTYNTLRYADRAKNIKAVVSYTLLKHFYVCVIFLSMH